MSKQATSCYGQTAVVSEASLSLLDSCPAMFVADNLITEHQWPYQSNRRRLPRTSSDRDTNRSASRHDRRIGYVWHCRSSPF